MSYRKQRKKKNIPLIVTGLILLIAVTALRSQLGGSAVVSVIQVGALIVILSGFGVAWTRKEERRNENEAVTRNNVRVYLDAYRQLQQDYRPGDLELYRHLINTFTPDMNVASATFTFAQNMANHKGETLSLKQVVISMIIAQMHSQRGSEPTQDEKLLAYKVVKEMIIETGIE